MSLSKFQLPGLDVRLIKHDDTIYKFKLQYRNRHTCTRKKIPCDEDTVQQELKNILKVVLKNQEALQPMKSDHFIVYPYKRLWKTAKQLQFWQNGKTLKVSAYVFNIHLEDNTDRQVEIHTDSDSSISQDNEQFLSREPVKKGNVGRVLKHQVPHKYRDETPESSASVHRRYALRTKRSLDDRGEESSRKRSIVQVMSDLWVTAVVDLSHWVSK